MSLSSNSSLVRRTIDLNYDRKQRSASLKWIVINGILFLLFTYDLWRACPTPGYRTSLQWAQAALCALLAANVLGLALRLAPLHPHPRAAPPSPLRAHPDSSFHIAPDSPSRGERSRDVTADLPDVSTLSPARSWRGTGAGGGESPSGNSPPSPSSPSSPSATARDEFISDFDALDSYLRERERAESEAASWNGAAWPHYSGGNGGGPPPPAYRVSPLQGGTAPPTAEEGGAPPPAGGGGGEHVWRRIHLEPHHISQRDLNLRRWLHATVVRRVADETRACEAALAGAGSGGTGSETAPAVAPAACPALVTRARVLVPFLRPFGDREYVVRRIRELAASPCLAAYRWDGGGATWSPGRPTDAELLMHLFATYLDCVAPGSGASAESGGGGGAFSSRHVSAAPAPPPRAPRALVLHRARAPPAPPHYVLVREGDVLEVSRGRNNLVHTLLLFVACAARRDPPELCRLHLGPAGLNLLWVLDR